MPALPRPNHHSHVSIVREVINNIEALKEGSPHDNVLRRFILVLRVLLVTLDEEIASAVLVYFSLME